MDEYLVFKHHKPISDIAEVIIEKLNLSDEQAELVRKEVSYWESKNTWSYYDYYPNA